MGAYLQAALEKWYNKFVSNGCSTSQLERSNTVEALEWCDPQATLRGCTGLSSMSSEWLDFRKTQVKHTQRNNDRQIGIENRQTSQKLPDLCQSHEQGVR